MKQCLICLAILEEQLNFMDLLLLKRKENDICQECLNSFEEIPEEHCPTCYKAGDKKLCKDCQYWQERGLEVAHKSLYTYNKAMKDYFSRYKFQGDYLLRNVFSLSLRKELKNFQSYTILSIPLSESKMRKRGFNQVSGLLEAAQIPYQEILKKKESQTQSSKDRKERLENTGNFYMIENTKIPKKILLVDDIYTTGATLQDAKLTLFENGAKEIMTFSLAR